MIKFVKSYFEHHDTRGSITGLVNFGSWEEFNLIESEIGISRGNHFHKYTSELFVILQGKIKITVQRVSEGRLTGDSEEYEVQKGDVFYIPKNVNHTFDILEYSSWLNALSVKTDPKNPDINRPF